MGISQAIESCHPARVSRHPVRICWWGTNRLPNHAIGLESVAIQIGFIGRELTSYRISPSGSCQSPSSVDSLVGNSQASELRHRARVSRHRGFLGEELTSYRTTPSGSSQLPSRADSLVGNSQATESRHRARVSRHTGWIRWLGTHRLPNHAIGLESVTIQSRSVGRDLTRYRITPSGSSQSSSRADSLLGISLATESRHRARVSHRERICWWRPHPLPNHAIGLESVAIQSGFVGGDLTSYRVTPSGSSQSPSGADSLVGNSPATEPRHRSRVSRYPDRIRWWGTYRLPNHAIGLESVSVHIGFVGGELTSYRTSPSGSSQSAFSEDSLAGNSLATESRHRTRVSRHPERIRRWEAH